MDATREFVSGMFTALGGVVEATPAGLDALLPADQAAGLALPEEVRVRFDAGAPEEPGTIDGRIGSPLIDRLVRQRLGSPPMAALAVPAELPRRLPDSLPVLLNAVRAGAAAEVHEVGRYLKADVRVALVGDEVRSVLESVWVRLVDGAAVSALRVDGAYPVAAAALTDHERATAGATLRDWVRRRATAALGGALAAVQRRTRRDLERMADYYRSLDAEMAQAAARARSAEERARRLAKQAALPEDLAARRAQLRERMKLKLSAHLVAATLVETDIRRFELPVQRRAQRGTVAMLLRAGDGVFEGPACGACVAATVRLYLCDEALHVLCDACGQSGRLDQTRCRACRTTKADPMRLVVDDPTATLALASA